MTSTPDTLIQGTLESRPRFVHEDWKGSASSGSRWVKAEDKLAIPPLLQ
jgi:hypothetical protein